MYRKAHLGYIYSKRTANDPMFRQGKGREEGKGIWYLQFAKQHKIVMFMARYLIFDIHSNVNTKFAIPASTCIYDLSKHHEQETH